MPSALQLSLGIGITLGLSALIASERLYAQGRGTDHSADRFGLRQGLGVKSRWMVAGITLKNPTDRSISIDVRPRADVIGFIEYRKTGSSFTSRSASKALPSGRTEEIRLNGLTPNSNYGYRFCSQAKGEASLKYSPTYHFQTRRPPGTEYRFEVESVPPANWVPKPHEVELYERTLLAILAERPDFDVSLLDSGTLTSGTIDGGTIDHGRIDQGRIDRGDRQAMVGAEDAYLELISHSAPVFRVPAHEGNPIHRTYFAWTWGDALFVVVDAFRGAKDPWEDTLGKSQYDWLKKTLESSDSKYKFVFAHHVAGANIGGMWAPRLFEWGGYDQLGRYVFPEHRPGWAMPIQTLLAKNRVSVLFQGQDLDAVRQVQEGVAYENVPSAAGSAYPKRNELASQSGLNLTGCSRIRVTVGPDRALIEYVRTFLPGKAPAGYKDNEVAFSYSIYPHVMSIGH